MNTTAIIVAAGESSRMGESVSKQLLPIKGAPVLVHTLSAFEQANSVNKVIVVCRTQDISAVLGLVEKYGFTKVHAVAEGGSTRQASVQKGVLQVDEHTEYIAVHDGARPLVRPEDIDKVVRDAQQYGSAALGVKVKDTVKVVDEGSFIVDTPNRETLVSVQTPQVFKKNIYLHAVKLAQEQGKDYTDDCQLLEAANQKVYITMGDYGNIKVTTPEDIPVAEKILNTRGL